MDFGFNAPGTLSYRLRAFDGKGELRSVEVPNNYCLEVEQLGRCIAGEETPCVTEEFSVALADTVDRILKKSAIKYISGYEQFDSKTGICVSGPD